MLASFSLDDLVKYFDTHVTSAEWLAFALNLLLGLILMVILSRVVASQLKKRLGHLDSGLADRVVAAISGPLNLLIFGYFFLLGFDQFKGMPGSIWQRVHDLYDLINLLVLLLFAFRLADIAAFYFRGKIASGSTELDTRWADLVGYVLKGIILIGALISILNKIGINVLGLVTGASFLGAAVALASQKTIGNIIGSLEIMMDRLFKEGDRISFGEYDGFVTKMGLRSIELTAITGERINLPNKDVADQQIRNYSRQKHVRTVISVGLTYDHNRAQLERAMQLLIEIIGAHPRVREVNVVFRKFGESSLDLDAIFWADYKVISEYNALMNELNLTVKDRFDAEKIEFAFPTRTIVMQEKKP
jgi:MscS family membrane protein